MQSRVPVIASNRGGPVEILESSGKYGLLGETENPETLSSLLAELIDTPLRRQELAENGYHRYNQAFTLNAWMDGWCSLFAEYTEGTCQDGSHK